MTDLNGFIIVNIKIIICSNHGRANAGTIFDKEKGTGLERGFLQEGFSMCICTDIVGNDDRNVKMSFEEAFQTDLSVENSIGIQADTKIGLDNSKGGNANT